MTKRIGRTVFTESREEKRVPLSFFRKIRKKYYEFRIMLIEKRTKKYGVYSGGYQLKLFHAAVYLKQSYLYKIDALYSKQEIRDFERRVSRNRGL